MNTVQTEYPINDNFNLILANYYFAPQCNIKIIENYFNFLEQNLNIHQF